MFEQDYIMRFIKDLARALGKLIFNREIETITLDSLEDEDDRERLSELLDLVDNGDINQAENLLYEMCGGNNVQDMDKVIVFYNYLNEKTDEFLKEHDYSREEIRTGLEDFSGKYGLQGFVELF